eukprot:TRINITY_DN39710_c0_g1_i1.p1 TRINITY_DN39710_c0_g1~~TRINITY_DN39710_c0_g1_i1.p1  ORF type:complete len:302 (+),score=57.29 TRINITY_DN39710_c0_g1_i1:147-1052(+)
MPRQPKRAKRKQQQRPACVTAASKQASSKLKFEVCFDDNDHFQPVQPRAAKPSGPINPTSKLRSLLSTPSSVPRQAGAFSDQHSILMVGEGDFSFAMALASRRGTRGLLASSFDSLQQVMDKYPTGKGNLEALRKAEVPVYGGVDATNLGEYPWMQDEAGEPRLFDRVAFNFPHCGGSSDEDLVVNQGLLAGFFQAAAPFLSVGEGKAVVTLRDTSFYQSWDIRAQAKTAGLFLHDSFPFDAELFHTYAPVRTNPAAREAPEAQNATVYLFGKGRKKKAKPGSDSEGKPRKKGKKSKDGES